MKFSEITTAVYDAWRFAWPPIIACLLTYGVARWLYPAGVQELQESVLARIQANSEALVSARQLLEPFGLTKLVPVISFILVIAFLFLVNTAAMVWMSRLPPFLSYQPAVLISDRLSTDEKLMLLRRYPSSRGVSDAFNLALQDWQAQQTESRPNRAENYYRAHSFLKFTFAVAVITLLLAFRAGDLSASQIGRFLLLLLVATLLWFLALIGLVYHQEQDFSHEWSQVRLGLQPDAVELLKEPASQEEQKILDHRIGNERWWRVYFLDPYRLTWFKRTFLGKP